MSEEKKRKKTSEETTVKLVVAAVFAALSCVATMVIQIPTPTGGYVHMGDCIVLLCGLLLGPIYGGLAAGIGSAMADFLTGYMHYVPGTFVIKALVAIVAYLVYYGLEKALGKLWLVRVVIAGVLAEIVMVVGYFFYKWVLLGSGLAAGIDTILGNVGQGAFGVVVAVVLFTAFYKNSYLRRLTEMYR